MGVWPIANTPISATRSQERKAFKTELCGIAYNFVEEQSGCHRN